MQSLRFGSQRPRWGVILRAGLVLAIVVPPLLVGCGSGKSGGPSALLITMDTTRADALGCYGGPAGITPHLDRLAAEGVQFDRAHTVAAVTMPSHTSMMTGLYPLRHAVRANDRWALSEEADTLAERAREHGLQTGAIVAAAVLRQSFGLGQGFDSYDEPQLPKTSGVVAYTERKATEVIDKAIHWLDERDRDRPFFLWVHLFDAHETYTPPDEFRTRFPGPRGLYYGEVAYADREVGRLLGHLAAEGIADDTFVMVVGDHGESLGDHGEATHGVLCNESTLHVPMLLRYPDRRHAGERVSSIVSVIDVFPTLVEALGLKAKAGIDGQSLLDAPRPADRGIYFESYEGHLAFGYSPLAGWMDDRGKYVHGSTPQFYDLETDPGELDRQTPIPAALVAEYKAKIADLAALPALSTRANTAADEATVESLRKLGYAAVGTRNAQLPHPLSPTERPLALDVIQPHAELVEGINLFHQGHLAEAEVRLTNATQAMPWSPAGLLFLSQALAGQKKYAEAITPIRQFLADHPRMGFMHYHLGNCLREVGRPEEAVESLKQAVVLEAGSKEYYPLLIRTLIDLQRPAEAQPLIQVYEELKSKPSHQ